MARPTLARQTQRQGPDVAEAEQERQADGSTHDHAHRAEDEVPLDGRSVTAPGRHVGGHLAHHQGRLAGDGVGVVVESPLGHKRKFEPDPARPRHLITEPGLGYRLEPDPLTVPAPARRPDQTGSPTP